MSNNTPDTELQQTQQGILKKDICNTWGDRMEGKENEDLRITFQNINGFGRETKNNKSEEIRQFIEEFNVDVCTLAEMNVNWKLVGKKNTISDITRGWFDNQRIKTSYNHHDKYGSKHQPGGTAVISRGETALRVIQRGEDKRFMGRWSWQLLRGKEGIKLRIIALYFPNSTKHFGHKKVYVQQQRVLLAQKIKESVWTTFWKDFMEEVDEWLEQGDQLVIAGDWNSDVRKRNFLEKLKQRNLWPAITGIHGTEGPGTFHNGSVPIDEIFISPRLKITGCGYMEHGINIGDHRPVWIDISKSSALGSSLPTIPSFQARRLKCNDPKVVERYSQRLEEQLRKNKFFSKLKTIFENFTVPLTEEQEFMMEELDEIREQAMLWAKKKVQKTQDGGTSMEPRATGGNG